MKMTEKQQSILLLLLKEATIPMNGTSKQIIETAKDLDGLIYSIESARISTEESEGKLKPEITPCIDN